MSVSVAVIIPAYNEAFAVADVIKSVNKVFSKASYKYEVIVINDGSTDDTSQVAGKAKATVVDHILNTGSGGATATGIRYAQVNNFDVAVTMDADLQHSAKDVLRGVDELIKTDADLLIGSRLIDTEGMPAIKVFGNKGLSFLTYLLFKIKITDTQSGLRVYSKKAINKLRWRTTGYEFCSEMLWRAEQSDMKIAEYPIEAIYTEYSMQKGQNNWNSFNIIKSLLKQRILEAIGE